MPISVTNLLPNAKLSLPYPVGDTLRPGQTKIYQHVDYNEYIYDARVAPLIQKQVVAIRDLAEPKTPAEHADTHIGGGEDEIDGASPLVAGLLPGTDKSKLNELTQDVLAALQGTDGTPSDANRFVTTQDDRLESPENSVSVGSAGADFTSIKEAVDYVIAQGAGPSNPWQVIVYPGTYVEPPMTIQTGVSLSAFWANRIDTAIIVAQNPLEDLFTCTGGYVCGFRISGVTDPAKALFRFVTPNTLTVLHGISIRGCSTGLSVENGAAVVLTNFSIELDGPGQAVTTGVYVTDPSSYVGIVGAFLFVPPALLPAYPGVNPVQTGISVNNNAQIYITSASISLAYNDLTADAILANSGAVVHLFASDVSDCANGIHVSAGGADTKFVIHACSFLNNDTNGRCDSATGAVMISATADDFKWAGVPGSILSGTAQLQNTNTTYLIGLLNYTFAYTGASLKLHEWFHDQSSTGLAWPEVPVVKAGGLDVFIPAGRGYVTRHVPDHDTLSVEWPDTTLTLPINSVNYIEYDSVTNTVTYTHTPPGSSAVLLAIAYTDATEVRFLHVAHNLIHEHDTKLHEYLVNTRKIVWNFGLAVETGTTAREVKVNSGSYYRALELIDYAGSGGDAVFSSFYGTDGATEIPALTQIDITNYDDAGSLNAMTGGWFRSDTLYLTSDGRVSIIYGTAEHAAQTDAEADPTRTAPSFIAPTGISLARLIVEQGAGIVNVVDIRPIAHAALSGGGGVAPTAHGGLTGLDQDDHIQYLLASGTRAMAGSLNLGGNAVQNVSTVDGVVVSAHAGRHAPGGVDAVATGVPVTVLAGTAASEGTAASLARQDHQHGVGVGTPGSVGTANLEGSAATVSRSDHQHAGLTRDAADIHGFPNKAAPASADVLLLEDSADGWTKKKLEVGNLPIGGSAPMCLEVAVTATDTTASTVDVVIAGMTITPPAGTWLVNMSGSFTADQINRTVYANLYYGGVVIQSSERRYYRSGNQQQQVPFCCVAKITTDGSTAIEGRWRLNTGGSSGAMYERTLHLLRVM